MTLIITGSEKYKTDPYRSQVSLLLHGDGANGSTTIVDSSPSPKAVTAFGNAQISTAQSKFGGSSLAFDGSGDYLTLPTSNQLSFGVSDFTLEGWIYVPITNASFRCIFSIGRPFQVYHHDGTIDCSFSESESAPYFTSQGPVSSITANTWTHFAVTRSGTVIRTFVNGVAGNAVNTTKSIFQSSTQPAIGTYLPSAASFLFAGYIDDLRITKGVARYTSNFTPPTAPFPDI
jgi:hypothetical protein